jgi:hypothetical protein
MTTTIKEDALAIINSFEKPQFTMNDVLEEIKKIRPDINLGTLRTTVGRDLKFDGYVKMVGKIGGKGNPGTPRIYERIEQPEVTKTTKRYKQVTPEPEPKQAVYSYSVIGKSIEKLLEEKNQLIAEFEKENKKLEKQLLDAEATIQERERHINQQTLKIHELSEKCRSRSGGAIKLDELQQTIRNATTK